ncbi:hypothetical protein GCK72_015330 [Caenorhabditis remanei]|uniref:BHLH domain-containing protein n=1 Tax=Caenorhabditis remanei TaxID=31234 RepID=A0A6A5GTS5_CAERE|nr:hypothetical protein GCK72_015328 [Caenorhabditis remanei]XP_053585558.1 hypothetical protein GCK72_015330 [Caenorhabditis remanei]KAF1758868.1 hypothetical protein GCK72_015328 [Caenorhabditis remanei]KAF1758870.1 hypothetical protein GCK72_015330 [Caenorhabditis remanei]
MARKMPKPDPERRSRANMRERQRVSEMNGMFEVLIRLLPPSLFQNKLSRSQKFMKSKPISIKIDTRTEAAFYTLTKHLQSSLENNGLVKFPHIFREDRKQSNDGHRRPLKLKEGVGVTAFISRYDLPSDPVPVYKPTPVLPQSNVYFAYF